MIREWEGQNGANRIKICAVTADANSETQDRCLSEEGGFDLFLTKPLRKNALREMITQCCGEDRLPAESEMSVPRNNPDESQNKAIPAGASHILIVDDAPAMRLLLRTFLCGMGCQVSEASSGESAVELVRSSFSDKGNSEPIEMIICDMRMPPGINGIETARRIKEIPGATELPIIGMVSLNKLAIKSVVFSPRALSSSTNSFTCLLNADCRRCV
jgi:CheY-like chemotaxis protein